VIGDRDRVEIDPLEASQRDATILGMSIGNTSAQEMRSIHAALFASLANKTLQPVISQELPLAEAAQAHREVLKPGSSGKIVLLS
jgi:NADPH2:quinone reductase